MPEWKVLRAGDAGWDALPGLPGGSLFHSARWARVLERGFGGPVLVAALTDDPTGLLAGWPGCVLNLGLLRILYGVFPKGSFVGPGDLIVKHLEGFREVLQQQGVHLVRMIVCEDDPVRELPGGRLTLQVRHVLDLSGKTPETLWAGYKQIVRRQVRQAQKAGLAVRPMRREEFPAFHDMQRQMLARNASATGLSAAFYEAIWDELAPDGTAQFLMAEAEGRPAGAIIGLHDGSVTYYFAGCSHNAMLDKHPNDLLMHALIESAVQRGAQKFDFLSSDRRDEGLIRFKAKWGSEPRPWNLWEWWFSPWRCWGWHVAMLLAKNPVGAALLGPLRRLSGR